MAQLITIIFVVQSCVYLPNREQAIVKHGTMQTSSTLTLIGILCVPSFSFNLINWSAYQILLLFPYISW